MLLPKHNVFLTSSETNCVRYMASYTPLSGNRALKQARLAENVTISYFWPLLGHVMDLNHRHILTYQKLYFFDTNYYTGLLICLSMNFCG